jgi:AraC family transcriptional activator of pobA
LTSNRQKIPIYTLESFSSRNQKGIKYQVEVFDANRHFQVQYPHKHDFFEVLFLNQGSGIHIIDSNKYEIKPPCIFFLSPGQAHKLELSSDIGGFIYLFTSEFYLMNQKNSNRLLEFPFFYTIEQENPPLIIKSHEDEQFIEHLFNQACKEMIKEQTVRSEEKIRSVLDLILLHSEQFYPKSSLGSKKKKVIFWLKTS